MENLRVVEMWWKGNDCYVATEDGHVTCYRDARFDRVDFGLSPAEGTNLIIRDETVSYVRPRVL